MIVTSLKQAENETTDFSLEPTEPLSKTPMHRKQSEVTASRYLSQMRIIHKRFHV